MRLNTLKQSWNDGANTTGLWLSTPSTLAAEQLGGLGYDYLNIDMQHGVVDYADVVALLAVMQRSEAVPTVRVPWNEPGIIGKVLDAGAMGVIVPMVNSRAEAERAVAACRYAPRGSRSYGPIRAAAALGPDYPAEANDEIAVIPMIETVQAIEQLDDILSVPGIDAVYVGPADLSLTLGLAPLGDHDEPRFDEALATIVSGCRQAGIVAGIHANPAIVEKRFAQGFQMVTATSDHLAMLAGARHALVAARGDASDVPGGGLY